MRPPATTQSLPWYAVGSRLLSARSAIVFRWEKSSVLVTMMSASARHSSAVLIAASRSGFGPRTSSALHLFGDQSGRSTSWTSITSVAGASLVNNAPALDGWYLLRGHAGAMSRTTGIYALLFSGLSRREGARGEVGVARIEGSRTR